jgi:flagellar FliL protein
MLRLLIPVVLVLVGLGAGVGLGLVLRPEPEPPVEAAVGDGAVEPPLVGPPPEVVDPDQPREYVALPNQFVVPLVEGGRVGAMMILSISVEVEEGARPAVEAAEPKLRDALLQVLFEHANAGGFRGSFTDGPMLRLLRQGLREAAARVLGEALRDVLITEIVRQDA